MLFVVVLNNAFVGINYQEFITLFHFETVITIALLNEALNVERRPSHICIRTRGSCSNEKHRERPVGVVNRNVGGKHVQL